MSKSKPNAAVDAFIDKQKKWQEELRLLRNIVTNVDTDLEETIKWNQPCYTYQNNNVLILSAFKDHCAINFLKGTLLKDTAQILVAPGENSQSAKFFKCNSLNAIKPLQSTIKVYVQEAIAIEKAGLKVTFKKIEAYDIPKEFETQLKQTKGLQKAFQQLTPGRQRQYLMHFASAKQVATRVARIEKCLPQIMAGKGLND